MIATMVTACGDKSESPDLRQQCDPSTRLAAAGWEDAEGNQIFFGTDCFGRTVDACWHSFSWNEPVNNQMLITVNSAASPDSGCLTKGEHVCSILHLTDHPESLIINCGKGEVIYTRGITRS